MERRTFLSAGSVSALVLASGYTSVFSGSVSDDPTEPVGEYYSRAGAAESREQFATEITNLVHSVSPLPDVAESSPSVFDGALEQELVDVDLVEKNVSADTIRNMSAFLAGSVSDEEVATLAETNAVVAVTLESDRVMGGTLAKEWLVAPEDDEWRLVWFDDRNSPRAAAREFFRKVKQTEFAGQLDEPIGELAHPSSPLLNVVEYTPWYFRGIRRRDLVGTEVVAENIDTGEIVRQFDPVTSWLSQAEVESVAEENAVVAVTLRDDQLNVKEFEQEWLVATADGEWRLVWF